MPESCPYCGGKAILLEAEPVWFGKPRRLHGTRRRYLCTHCGEKYVDELWYEEKDMRKEHVT